VAYFAALLARTDDGWEASEVDLDEVEDLAGLADLMRESAVDDGTVLLLLEQEDTWFALVRLDGDDDPRVFVSDHHAVLHSAYAEMLLPELDETVDIDAIDPAGVELVDEDDEDEVGPILPTGPAGDPGLLDDFGIAESFLRKVCADALPTDALSMLAERAGAADALESVR
jgi:putative tRNA adenosine deaminase-associated protein